VSSFEGAAGNEKLGDDSLIGSAGGEEQRGAAVEEQL
jgi:hypothetical protein